MFRAVGPFPHDAAARALYGGTLGWIMSDAQYNLDRLNVLVLNDNRNMRALIESILFALGVRKLHEAHDVKQAFRDLQYFHADIVITDWHMEPLNGLDFVRMVRSGEDSPDPYVPIIMLTGHTELHRVCEARAINLTLAERPGPIVPLIAEIGGQNTMIVDSSALPEQVVKDVITSAFGSAGQLACIRRMHARGGCGNP